MAFRYFRRFMDIMNRLLPFTKLPDCFNKYAFRLCISVFVISVIFGGESVLPFEVVHNGKKVAGVPGES